MMRHGTGDAARNRITVELSTGLEISFSPKQTQGLETARPDKFSEIEITPSGPSLHFPKIDADIYIPALLDGTLGSAKWMAGQMGRAGAVRRFNNPQRRVFQLWLRFKTPYENAANARNPT